jgi:RNA polymerase sigma factor (sigma-70 family)
MTQCSRHWQLLRQYVEQGCEQAFAELVAEHIDLVYSSALRQVRDRHLAEEVTQVVFIILARKAGSLGSQVLLPAWLHNTTRYTAMNLLRAEARRQTHERRAAKMKARLQSANAFDPFSRVDSSWKHLEPVLDQALARLNERDRAAILLRYFQHKSIAQTAEALGISEPAAGMRLHRAVEKLRSFFQSRGVSLPAAALMGVISANAIHPAPPGLASTVAPGAVHAATHAPAVAGCCGQSCDYSSLADSVIRTMAVCKAKSIVGVCAAVIVVTLLLGLFTHVLMNSLISRPSPPREEPHTFLQAPPQRPNSI